MNNKEPLTELAKALGEKHAVESQKIIENNIRLSTKLSAMLCMFEAYYVEFSQNQKELIRRVNSASSGKAAGDNTHLKQILRTSKNKLNKINNQDARFYKFYKEFNLEFTKYFGDGAGEMSSNLLDALDTFWNNVVRIDEKSVGINQEFIDQ